MNNILKKVFGWMTAGLLVTFITAFVVASNPNMIYKISSTSLYWILAIIEIILVIVLSARITKMSPTTARIIFILYSFFTGLTLSTIFVVYSLSSIIVVFLITAVLFAVLSLIGYLTKIDLSKLGTYLFMMLIGIIICAIANIFIGNGVFEIVICSISVLVFLGFTAYDVKKIKQLSEQIDEDKLAIYGALQLYLDFINLFLDLLRLFGRRD